MCACVCVFVCVCVCVCEREREREREREMSSIKMRAIKFTFCPVFVLFRLIKKRSFNLLCVLDP